MKRLTPEREHEIRCQAKAFYTPSPSDMMEVLSEIDVLRDDMVSERITHGMLYNENIRLTKERDKLKSDNEALRKQICASLSRVWADTE